MARILIGNIKPTLVNNALTTQAGLYALDAAMGKTLDEKIGKVNSDLGNVQNDLTNIFGGGVQKTISVIDAGNTVKVTMYADSAGAHITSRNFATGTATRLSITDNHLTLYKFTFTVNPDGTFRDVSAGSETIV